MLSSLRRYLREVWDSYCESEVRRNAHYTGLIPPTHFIPKNRKETNVRDH